MDWDVEGGWGERGQEQPSFLRQEVGETNNRLLR